MITELFYTIFFLGYLILVLIGFCLIPRYQKWIIYLQFFLGFLKFIFLGFLALHVVLWCNEEILWRSLKGLAVILMTLGEVENLKLVKKKLKYVRQS